ncbi:class III extradiol ring-cleavage dioxygenase [Paenibacillus ginsengihumi]|uniref:DODA-type extradiol aromatic ring-opening family dioxygenase n=1 Tax=Paenibacillus ginsengihumi TaxID=431596 RepID=UPI0003A20C2A
MTASALPALFLAHGAPTLATEQHDYAAWLRKLGGILPRPEAVVVFSAYWSSPVQRIGCADTYETLHDFFGFPAHLYRLQYPASGDSSLARRIRSLLAADGIASELDGSRGLDHGAWGPLMLMYPDADIPVVAMSVNPALVAEEHYRIGRSLGRLRRERADRRQRRIGVQYGEAGLEKPSCPKLGAGLRPLAGPASGDMEHGAPVSV